MRNFIKAFSVATFVLLIFLTAGCGGAGNNLPSASGNNEPDPSIDNPTDDPTLSSAKALTSYSILGINGTINQSAKSVSLKVPFGTDLSSLVATFGTTGKSVEVDGVEQESGITENDFSSPVMYRVFAEDNSSVQYTIAVTAAENSSKTLTDFSLSGVAGIINESDKTVRVQLPSGTDVSSLVATFGTTGASVEIDGVEQISGVTENDFSSPVTYVIKATDESSIQYVVTVTVAPSEAKEITSFSILGIVGVVDELTKTIQITVPFGTNVSALVPTFTTTGASVEVDDVTQVSGVTQNDFNLPVIYAVNAGDSSSVEYTVSVIVAQNTAKEITSFSIMGVAGVINEPAKTIAITLPHGTDVTSLVATFSTTAASIIVGVTEQSSGVTANNFTSPVLYTATAADGSVAHYTVTVTIALDSSKSITSYSILGVNGTINEAAKTISITLPYGTSVTNLVATFSITGISAKVGAVAQISGVTSNNFTSPVTYTITAENSSTVQYTVTVTVALNSAKQITSYFVLGAAGVINEAAKTIAVTAPYGTNVSALIAQFTTTGASVKVGSTVQVSGVTPNNFNSPVVYTVRAADSSSVQYTVTLTFYVLPLVMNPTSKTLAVGNSFTFSASGGVPPYSFSADNGSINSSTGLYTAPGSAGTAIVTVTDSEVRTATATVTINPAISIAPNTATLISGESVTFVGAGGVPPYTYSGNSLSVNPTTGLLTASVAATGSVTVTDSLGNSATTGDVITQAFVEKDDTYLFCTNCNYSRF